MARFRKFAGAIACALCLFGLPSVAQQLSCPRTSAEVENALAMARKNAQQVVDKYLRADLSHEIAKEYVRNGDFTSALEIIRTDSALMWQASDALSQNMLRCGRASEVEPIALSLQGRSRSLMLQWLAEWEAKHSNQGGSDAALAEIKDGDIRTDAQFNIAIENARHEDPKTAELTLRAAVKGPDDQIWQDMALVYVLNGDIDDAMARLDEIKGREKIYALYVLTGMMDGKTAASSLRSFGEAVQKMTRPYLQDSDQAYPLSLVATALANISLFDDAIELANNIPDQQRRTEALTMTAARLILAKSPARAEELVRSLPKPSKDTEELENMRQGAWLRVAIAETNVGNGVAALQTLQRIQNPNMSLVLDWQRAYAQARTGNFVAAEATAAKIPQRNPGDERGNAFRLIAAVYANEKGASMATAWAGRLTTPQDRVSALLGVGDGLLGEPHEEIPPYFQD